MQSTEISSISKRVLQVVQEISPILERLAAYVREQAGRDDISIAHVFIALKPYLKELRSGAIKPDDAFIRRLVEEADALDMDSAVAEIRMGLMH
ncbi:hypothetical protein os4_21170 [Comamonadaceae bacterium OS-4]|nr:hypothetical protein os4_21170 [Comamonadaceae bacterium OS-4]